MAVINTPDVQRLGLTAGRMVRWLLRGAKPKRFIRRVYALLSLYRLKRGLLQEGPRAGYWQAGKSVGGIHAIESVTDNFAAFCRSRRTPLMFR
ncbi:MAG: hypothetical protein HY080_10800 [Gammaproteobacteria bacterium]|nr:hypothetical protein [Gammaproteobacteria bacterium]